MWHSDSLCNSKNFRFREIKYTKFGEIYLVKEFQPNKGYASDNYVFLHKPLSQETTPILGDNKHSNFDIDFSLPSKTGGRYGLFITNCIANDCIAKFNNMTSEQFYNEPSVKQAIQILKSLSY